MPEYTAQRPHPAEFSDYRAYLQALIAFLREHQPSFSYRRFSQKAGYTSPNFLKLVAEGKRNLSAASIGKFAKGLGLPAREQDAFEALVLLTQAASDEERNRYFARLRKARARREPRGFGDAQYDVYSLWYALPIREMMFLADFKEDPEWIAKRLEPPIQPAEAERALALLEKVGLARRDEKNRLVPEEGPLATPPDIPEVGRLAVRNYHRAMFGRAAEAMEKLPGSERNLSSVTVTLTKEQYEEVARRTLEFRRELLDDLNQRAEDKKHSNGTQPKDEPAEVYVVAFQVFPVTRGEKP